jgi:hypothetical protein
MTYRHDGEKGYKENDMKNELVTITGTEISFNSEQETAEQATENKPFNVTELLYRISNQMNEYNKNGKTEQIETLKWVIEQVQDILK